MTRKFLPEAGNRTELEVAQISVRQAWYQRSSKRRGGNAEQLKRSRINSLNLFILLLHLSSFFKVKE